MSDIEEQEYGLCKCGCGQKTKIAKQTDYRCGHVYGQHISYIHGHQSRGKHNGNYKGAPDLIAGGYNKVVQQCHRRANVSGYVAEHILIAEKAFGGPLPTNARIHHANGNKLDNRNENLVICENEKYHSLLHMRMRAYKACGNAAWRKCRYCGQYDDPVKLSINGIHVYHKSCAAEYQMKRRHAR